MNTGRIHVGTGGWHYRHWRKCFYPDRLQANRWLQFYAQRFSCVEVNDSFHKLPSRELVSRWKAQTPETFLFAIKGSRLISYTHKLRNCEAAGSRLVQICYRLQNKLGPVLFQLPPDWKVNADRLAEFLRILPRGLRYVFECRDTSWHNDAVYEVLTSHTAAFCIYDLNGFRSPEQITADFVYIRLHGAAGTSGSYSAVALRHWAERMRGWCKQGKDVFLFFTNDHAGYAVKNARTTLELLGRACDDSNDRE